MGRIIKRLFRKNTHIKPIHSGGLFGETMITVKLTPIENFFDDWQRYGVRVAWYNLKWMLKE